MRRPLLIALLLLAAAGGYAAYRLWGVPGSLPEGLLQANGRLEGDHALVAGKFAGRVAELLAAEGDAVTAGQVLARLDDAQVRTRVTQAEAAVAAREAELEAARASLSVLKAEVPLTTQSAEAAVARAEAAVVAAGASARQAGRDARRLEALRQRGTVDQQRSEQARLAAEVAQADLATAEAGRVQTRHQLSQARLGPERIAAQAAQVRALAAQLDQARAALAEARSVADDLAVRAPAAGVVITRVAELGEVVAAGTPLFDLVDLDRLYLKVYVPEAQIGRLRRGLPARIHTDAFPDAPFPARVTTIATRAQFTPKEVQTPDERVRLVFAVKIALDANPDHRLTPGLPADAVIRWREDVPWAPPRW